MPEEKKVQDDKNEKGKWHKKLFLLQEMNIIVVFRYSRCEETLLSLTYEAMGAKLTEALEVFDGCRRLKKKCVQSERRRTHELKIREREFWWTRLVHYQKS